jgi:N4-gp56 family major capsid protein
MADAYTTTASVAFDQTAFDLRAFYALRPELYFDSFADVGPVYAAHPGAQYTFTIVTDLAAATATLNQSADLDAVAMADSQVSVTPLEKGNVVITTALLRGTSFIPFDPVVANAVGYNAGLSLDTIARAIMEAGSNVRYATGGGTDPTSRLTVEANDTLVAADVRRALADLRNGNAPTFGGQYAAIIHPDVSYDLRGETGAAAWRDPHTYSAPDAIWNGENGSFEGFRFMETPRGSVFADAGSSTTLTDVYRTLFFGAQALAKAYSATDGNGPYPQVVIGPMTDHLKRFAKFGWYWLGAYGVFRQACLRGVELASTIGTNA